MGRARAATRPTPTSSPSANCLRRGKPGHSAKDCAKPLNKKRGHPDESLMVDEVYWDGRANGSSAIPASNGVMHCRARR
eukprot:6988952-Pyramimonas_sp.AAC.1